MRFIPEPCTEWPIDDVDVQRFWTVSSRRSGIGMVGFH